MTFDMTTQTKEGGQGLLMSSLCILDKAFTQVVSTLIKGDMTLDNTQHNAIQHKDK
jgi:hypothetical protein